MIPAEREPRPGRLAVWTAVAGTVFIAAGAFWLSFTALSDLASRSGVSAGQAWAWPLIVDGIIVVATVSVVALAGLRATWYPWRLLLGGALVSVTANAMHAVVAADADVPPVLAASVAAVPPLVLLAITHPTVVLTRRFGPGEESSTLSTRAALSTDFDIGTVADAPREIESPRQLAARLRQGGMSNQAIARATGVHPSTVGRWLAGNAYLPDLRKEAAK